MTTFNTGNKKPKSTHDDFVVPTDCELPCWKVLYFDPADYPVNSEALEIVQNYTAQDIDNILSGTGDTVPPLAFDFVPNENLINIVTFSDSDAARAFAETVDGNYNQHPDLVATANEIKERLLDPLGYGEMDVADLLVGLLFNINIPSPNIQEIPNCIKKNGEICDKSIEPTLYCQKIPNSLYSRCIESKLDNLYHDRILECDEFECGGYYVCCDNGIPRIYASNSSTISAITEENCTYTKSYENAIKIIKDMRSNTSWYRYDKCSCRKVFTACAPEGVALFDTLKECEDCDDQQETTTTPWLDPPAPIDL